jgi:3-oxoacyl-[acyl-carrier-protein] synthase III
MANFTITNLEIKGISVAVPKNKIDNTQQTNIKSSDIENFIKHVGVHQFRRAPLEMTSSDLAFEAATDLIKNMSVELHEIEILIFVSQTPDYLFIPNTSTLLQHKLGLPKSTICFDLPLGCSGFTYGLSIIYSFMKSANLKKGLLLCADTISKISNPNDKSVSMLFGDAASALLIEAVNNASPTYFSLGTDGEGYKSIMIEEGGYRNPINENSIMLEQIEEGIARRKNDLTLNGMDVFSFGISQAPKSVRELYLYANKSNEGIDYAIFHQANKMMNEMIRKKLKLETEKVAYSLEKFGNTSSVSIPLTMATELKNELEINKLRLLLCGFGVGLSWGTCYLETDKIYVSNIVEL